jgi:hypothetical protein
VTRIRFALARLLVDWSKRVMPQSEPIDQDAYRIHVVNARKKRHAERERKTNEQPTDR